MQVADRPANDRAALRLNIARSYASLGENQQRIARFILEHPEEIVFMTIVGVAKRAEASPASLIRFAHALGYSGFREIRRVFENALASGTETQPQILDHAVRDLAAQGQTICDILVDVSTATIAAIRRLQGEPLITGIDQATGILHRAEQVYVLAEGRDCRSAAVTKQTWILSQQDTIPGIRCGASWGQIQGNTIKAQRGSYWAKSSHGRPTMCSHNGPSKHPAQAGKARGVGYLGRPIDGGP